MKNLLTIFTVLTLSLSSIISCKESVNKPEKEISKISSSTEFDVVILNGRVMDPETNLDAIRNVGIENGKITLITEEKIAGKEIIDATNYVVSPGFIDFHTHASNIPFGRSNSIIS